MKKFSKLVVMLCLVLAATLAIAACSTSDDDGIEFKSIDGYSAVTVDADAKKISFSVPSVIASFDPAAIKFNVAVTVTAFSDEARTNQLTTIALVTGQNTIYLTIGAEGISENWTLVITRETPAVTVSSIRIIEFSELYDIDEAFGGGKIEVTYSNDTVNEIDITVAMLTGFDTATAGQKTVTVTYEGKTATTIINVVGELAPTELDREDIEEDVSQVLGIVYLLVTGESVLSEDIVDQLFDGDQDLYDEVMDTIVEYLGALAFTSSEVSSLTQIAQDVQSIFEDVMQSIDGYDGTGSLFSVSLVGDLQDLYSDIKEVLHPVRMAQIVRLIIEEIPSFEGDISFETEENRFDYDPMIAVANALGLNDIKTALQNQKSKTDYEKTIYDYSDDSTFELDLTDRELVAFISDYFKVLDVILYQEASDIVRFLDYVLPLAFSGDPMIVLSEPDFDEIAFVFNFLGDIILEVEALELDLDVMSMAMFAAIGESLEDIYDEFGIDIVSVMNSSIVFSGNLLSGIDAETLEGAFNAYVQLMEAEDCTTEIIAPLSIYCARIIKIGLSAMTTAERTVLYADIASILNVTFDSFPDTKTSIESILEIADFDPDNLSSAQLEKIDGIIGLVGEFVYPPSRYTNLGYETLCVPVGTLNAQLIEILSERYILELGFGDTWLEVDFSDVTITGYNAIIAGYRTFTLTYTHEDRVFSMDVDYYVYDQNSVNEFVLLAKNSYYSLYDLFYEVGQEVLGEYDYNYYWVYYDLYFYNAQYDFHVNLYDAFLIENAADIVGISTAEASSSLNTAFVRVDLGDLFGDFYLPVSYGVYDRENPQLTSVLMSHAITEFVVGQEVSEIGSIRLEYNFGYDSSEMIGISMDMVSGLDISNEGTGEYTVTYVLEDTTYVFTRKYVVLSLEEAWTPLEGTFWGGRVIFEYELADMENHEFYVHFSCGAYSGTYTVAQLRSIYDELGIDVSISIYLAGTDKSGVDFFEVQYIIGETVLISRYSYMLANEEYLRSFWSYATTYFYTQPTEEELLEVVGDYQLEIGFFSPDLGMSYRYITISELFENNLLNCAFEFSSDAIYIQIGTEGESFYSVLIAYINS